MLGKKCDECGKWTYSKWGNRIKIICILIMAGSLAFVGLYFVKMGTMAKASFEIEMRVFNDFDWLTEANTSELTEDCVSQLCVADKLTQFVSKNSTEDMVCRHKSWVLKQLLKKYDIESEMITIYEYLAINDAADFYGHVMVEFTDEFNQTWMCDPENDYYCYESGYYLDFTKHWMIEEMSPSTSIIYDPPGED